MQADVSEHIDTASMAAASTVYAENVDIEVGQCVFVEFVLFDSSLTIIQYPHRSTDFFCILGYNSVLLLTNFLPCSNLCLHADHDLAVIHISMCFSAAADSL